MIYCNYSEHFWTRIRRRHGWRKEQSWRTR